MHNATSAVLRPALLASVLAFALPSWGQTPPGPVADPLDRPAMISRQALHSVLLAVARADRRLVAVGERGVVLLSDDGGKSWRQAAGVPVAVTLTAVQFISAKEGWAVGHSGVVLHTVDAGETWTRQFDGRQAAQMAVDALQARLQAHSGAPTDAALLGRIDQIRADGADKPFLDLYFRADGHGLLVGGYGLIFHTSDGGKTWAPWMDRIDNPKGLHLNAIRAVGDAIYIAGERGLVQRSDDGGQHFVTLRTPYEGSFFTIAAAPGGGVVLGGLRGNCYVSRDGGKTWNTLAVPAPVTLLASLQRVDGSLLLLNQAGQVFSSHDGIAATPLALPALSSPTALIETASRELVATGFRGAVTLSAPVPDSRTAHEK